MGEYYFDRDCASVTGNYLTEIEWQFICECLSNNLNNSAKIFDVGGGSGRFSIPIAKKGYSILVSDITPLPLKILHQKAPEIPAILLDSADDIFPLKSASVDCILCIEVFPLIEGAPWFFHECNRLLKKNGVIIFVCHNRCSYKGVYKKFILREDRKHGWMKFHYKSSLWAVRERLKKAGFELLLESGFNWIPVSRASNSKLIPLFAKAVKALRLSSFPFLSPWVIIAARKVKKIN